jgi:5-methylcytosine-specific restriction endonuclease McrA
MSAFLLNRACLNYDIWLEPATTRLVWITMMALADGQGSVDCSVKALASIARVPLENCLEAIDTLSKDFIEPREWGWDIVDRHLYRPLRSSGGHRYRRNFTADQRHELFALAGGECVLCKVSLAGGFHADHIVPWSVGGPTTITNGQALCPRCNMSKGASL